MLENLYKQYGQLMIKKEIVDNQIMTIKQQIANELNNSAKQVVPTKEPVINKEQ